MHDTGCLGLVHWDDPEGWNGEGGGRRVQDGEHMYTCGTSIFRLFNSFSKYEELIKCEYTVGHMLPKVYISI